MEFGWIIAPLVGLMILDYRFNFGLPGIWLAPLPVLFTLLGVAEVFGVAIGYSSYRDAIAFAILVLVLLVRPTGLLGQKIQKKV